MRAPYIHTHKFDMHHTRRRAVLLLLQFWCVSVCVADNADVAKHSRILTLRIPLTTTLNCATATLYVCFIQMPFGLIECNVWPECVRTYGRVT